MSGTTSLFWVGQVELLLWFILAILSWFYILNGDSHWARVILKECLKVNFCISADFRAFLSPVVKIRTLSSYMCICWCVHSDTHSCSLYLNLRGALNCAGEGVMVPFPCVSCLLTFILFSSLSVPSFPFPKIFVRNNKEKLFLISASWLSEFFIQDIFSHLPAFLLNPERS